jgi:hypothetical protein
VKALEKTGREADGQPHTLGTRTVTLDYVLGEGGGGRAGFRHVPHVPRHRAPTKWGAPQMKGPMQRQTPTRSPPDIRASMRWVRAPLSGGHLDLGPLEWDPIR